MYFPKSCDKVIYHGEPITPLNAKVGLRVMPGPDWGKRKGGLWEEKYTGFKPRGTLTQINTDVALVKWDDTNDYCSYYISEKKGLYELSYYENPPSMEDLEKALDQLAEKLK